LVALMIDAPKVIFAVGVVYILSGPLVWLWQRRRGQGQAPAA
jgi:CDP-diacylglycerol--serine O-phosphatidyltransferase